EESRYDQARTARAEGRKPDDPEDSKPKKEDEGEESAEEEKPAPKKVAEKKPAEGGYPATANPNAGGVKHVDHVGVELSRKQREELEKAAARRRYEQLHKEGKTDEAKADLARLAEVKQRRAEEKQKKDEKEALAKVEVVDAKLIGKNALIGELKAAMAAGNRKKGDKKGEFDEDANSGDEDDASKAKEVKEVYMASEAKIKEEGSRFKATNGTIEACRAAEDDFM
ncbi:unnamed protein product, partial [Polarella glacialis]